MSDDVKELLNKVQDETVRTQLSEQFDALSGSTLRKTVDDLQAENKTLKEKDRVRAFKDAGFDPESGPGKALAKLYDGEANPEAIQSFAKDEFGFEPTAADNGNGENHEDGNQPDPAQQRQQGEDRLNQLNQGSIPARDPSIDDQFNEAVANGDTATAGRLNAQKLAAARNA